MKVLVRTPTIEQLQFMETCPIWEHATGTFPWEYKEKQETCLIISGKGYVQGDDGNKFSFERGDLVTFPKHWKCTWTIIEDIKKYYAFDLEY